MSNDSTGVPDVAALRSKYRYPIKELSKISGVHERVIYRAYRRGDIEALRIGSRLYFAADAIPRLAGVERVVP